MVLGVDMAYTISSTITIITGQLQLPTIPIVVYIDLYSLYKYLVKLGTTKKKCLIINIIVI